MNLINVSSRKWTHSFALPSHYTIGPTVCNPHLDGNAIRRAPVTGNALPFAEDFSPDAFAGKVFVRLPHLTELHVSERVVRYRFEQPEFGAESMWLPDHCIVGANTLEQVLEARNKVSTASLARSRRCRGVN